MSTPVFVAHGHGATIIDVDAHSHLDMYVADMSAFCGHAPDAVVKAVSQRMALGNQFLMPGEDSIVVAEHLAGRYGMPKWHRGAGVAGGAGSGALRPIRCRAHRVGHAPASFRRRRRVGRPTHSWRRLPWATC